MSFKRILEIGFGVAALFAGLRIGNDLVVRFNRRGVLTIGNAANTGAVVSSNPTT